MPQLNIDLSKYDVEFFADALDRVEAAANVVAIEARRLLRAQVKFGWKQHGPYKRRREFTRLRDKSRKFAGTVKGGLVPYFGGGGGSPWTARHYNDMVNTIRVVRSHDPNRKNIWVMAGNYLTWWALQMEYGKGGWAGGRKSFMRPAMKNAESQIVGILEGGAIGQGEVRSW